MNPATWSSSTRNDRLAARLLLTLGLLFFAVVPAMAQKLSGRIVSDAGEAVAQVSVVAADAQWKTVAFARSAADGSFIVSVPEGREARWLVCSKMGFRRDTLAVAGFREGQTIVLSEAAVQIKEVRVKGRRIREEGDTLNYSVAAFQQKQDRSIADVIKKMPGMKVNADGSIEYEGQRINKFYVEGMDLTGSKYAQVSENLQADKVKRVQVLRNHQPVKALRNINFSEQAALNIVLKDDAKNVWQGFADLAAGHSLQGGGDWLADSRAMMMQFAKRRQSITMYKLNNTGKDIGREVMDVGALIDYAPTESPLLSNIALSAPLAERRRSTFNRTHMGATNWLFKTPRKHDLRLQMNGLWDRCDQQRRSETSYTDVASGQTVVEDVEAVSRRCEMQGEVQYKVNTDALYLTNSLKGYADFNSSNGLSQDGRGLAVREEVKPRRRYLTDQLRMVRNVNRHTYRLNAFLSVNSLPGELLLTDGAWQRLDLASTLWGASTGYGYRLGRVNLSWALSENGRHQRLLTRNPLADATDHYAEYKTQLSPGLSYKSDVWKLNFDLPLTWLARRLNGRGRSDVLLEPRLYVNFKPTGRWETTVYYNYAWSPLSLQQLSASPLFTSYLQMRQGAGHFDNTRSHSVYADVHYHDAIRGFFSGLRFSYSNLQDQQLWRSTLMPTGVYQREATGGHTHSDNWTVTGRVSEGFSVARLTVGLDVTLGRNNYSMLLAEQLTPCHMNTVAAVFSASAQPAEWFSVEETSSYDYSRQRVGVTQRDGLHFFAHQLKLSVMPGDWQVQWTTDVQHSSDPATTTNVFSDLSISYRRKRYEVGVYCYNLFGNRNYERRVVSTAQTVCTQNRLRPREITARVFFNI